MAGAIGAGRLLLERRHQARSRHQRRHHHLVVQWPDGGPHHQGQARKAADVRPAEDRPAPGPRDRRWIATFITKIASEPRLDADHPENGVLVPRPSKPMRTRSSRASSCWRASQNAPPTRGACHQVGRQPPLHGCGVPRRPARRMFVFVIEDQAHRAAADLRRKLVARIAHDGSTLSGVGASGKPGAVQSTPSVQASEIGVISNSIVSVGSRQRFRDRAI